MYVIRSVLPAGVPFLEGIPVPPVEKELLILPEHLSSPRVFSGVHVALPLVFCVVDRCLSFYPFHFGHCVVVCPSFCDSDYPFSIFKLFSIRYNLFSFFLLKSDYKLN